ncbi:hypothetical protein ADK56_06020 [Streptomyces sp. MMG1522]|nr:hypothetical protein ADK56_06020 [Streptomyces sp. MMG1522]
MGVEVDRDLNPPVDFPQHPHREPSNRQPGAPDDPSGKARQALLLPVPVFTVVTYRPGKSEMMWTVEPDVTPPRFGTRVLNG